MLKKSLAGILVFLIIVILVLILKKSPISPASYTPPTPPQLAGILSPNVLLKKAEIIAKGKINGPEDVDVDAGGLVYGGTQDGKIIRVLPDGKIETFADTGGRPLGMNFDKMGNLIVCDSYKGLLSIDPDGKIKTLATSADGIPFKFTDDVDIASDGKIYFSDASSKFGQKNYLYDLLEAKPYGRLLCFDPASGKVKVLIKGLYFANGIALSQKEDFVLVNETYRYRIQRYWLKGPKAGTHDIFINNLPGFPDGVSSNRKGRFWLALFTVRNNLLDKIQPHPFIKKIMSKLPHFLWPKPQPYGLVLSLDEEGNITSSLQDPSGKHLYEITSVQEHGDSIYLGSLHAHQIGKYKLPKE